MASPHVAGGAALILQANPEFSPAEVLQELVANSAKNLIRDAKSDNFFLWVSSESYSPPPPTPAPAPTPGCPALTSTGPDGDGDCRCNGSLTCYEDGSSKCTFSYTASRNIKSWRYFLPSCSGCRCQ